MVGSESRYQAFRDARSREGLRRSLNEVTVRDARVISVRSMSYVNLASNDYLAIRFHKALIRRAAAWAEAYGVGSGASRLVTGNLDLFAPIEVKIAQLNKKPPPLLMASRFQPNSPFL